jgi:NAD-dependent deacetylase
MSGAKVVSDAREAAQELAERIGRAKRVVFFGGAGVSTASGIPDFRSENGLYNQHFSSKYSPEELLSHHLWREDPEAFYDFYRKMMCAPEAKPNQAHKKLAELEREGKLDAVVTQNIDGLHQAAGSKNVIELHGSTHRNYCVKCGAEYSEEWMLQTTGVPHCPKCGGVVKPDVVLYGESLDEKNITRRRSKPSSPGGHAGHCGRDVARGVSRGWAHAVLPGRPPRDCEPAAHAAGRCGKRGVCL